MCCRSCGAPERELIPGKCQRCGADPTAEPADTLNGCPL